jgi:cell division GTPase FtsZ
MNRREFIARLSTSLLATKLTSLSMLAEARSIVTAFDCVTESKPLIVGIGGFGCNIVEQLRKCKPSPWRTLQVDRESETRPRDLRFSSGVACLSVNHAKNTWQYVVEPLAESDRVRIQQSLLGSDAVFLIASMGGGTGGFLAHDFACEAKALGVHTAALLVMPFEYEGATHVSAAENASRITRVADVVRRFDNAKASERLGFSFELPMGEILRRMDAEVIHALAEMQVTASGHVDGSRFSRFL